MRISGKCNTERENIHKKKKRINKLESPDENNEKFSEFKTEETSSKKPSKKNKDNKSLISSVTREYKRISPNYNIDDTNDKIKGMKHSSSTSKNFGTKFKREEDNSDEELTFKKSNNKATSKTNKNKYKKEDSGESMEKMKNKKVHKSKKSKHSEKLKKIILKLSSTEFKLKKCFYKWKKLSAEKKRKENEDDNDEEYEEIEEEEEVVEIEEEEDESELEKIEERAPDEEESTVAKQLSAKKKISSARMKYLLRNIIKFRNPLRMCFMKWYRISTNKKYKNDKSSRINKKLFINKKDLTIKNNLKNIIEFGKTRKRTIKKYYKIWRFITFNLEPVSQSNNKITQEDIKNNKKYISKSNVNDVNNRNKIMNEDKNTYKISSGRIKLPKKLKFLKQIIETLDDYKNISYAMSKWYFLSKMKKKSKKMKKHKVLNDNFEDISGDQQLAQSTYFNNNINSFRQNEVMLNLDKDNKILANSSNINDLNNKSIKKKKKDKEKNEGLKINKKEKKENKEEKDLEEIKRNNINVLPKYKNLINGVTPIGEVKVNQVNKNKINIEDIPENNNKIIINDKKSLKEKIEQINRKHKNNKCQRYLLVELPVSRKKNDKTFGLYGRESFTTLNIKIKLEHLQKSLIKLVAKTQCRKDNFLNCFDKWFDLTYNSSNYIPFLREKINTDEEDISKDVKVRTHKSKSKKEKKTTKKEIKKLSSDEIENSSELKQERNSLSSITNNINISESANLNRSKISESKGKTKKKNKLKEKKDEENKSKDKKIKKNEKDEKDLETPRQKMAKIENASSSAKEEFKRNMDLYHNIGKDPKLDLKALGVDIGESDEKVLDNNNSISKDKKSKKKKKHSHKKNNSGNQDLTLESTDNIILDNNEESSTNNEMFNLLDKNNSLENDINMKQINDLKNNLNKYNDIGEINPDVADIEIIQVEDSGNKKRSKRSKKIKNRKGNEEENDMEKSKEEILSVDIDQKYTKEERKLIKKYNKAFHKLRVVIRSYRKRRKEQNTINPDTEIKIRFQKWVLETFPQGLDQYRKNKNEENSDLLNTKNRAMKTKPSKSKSEKKEAKKLKKLKHVINLVNKKQKKLKNKLSENGDNDILKIYFNKWNSIVNKVRANDKNNQLIKKEESNEINKDLKKEKQKQIGKEINKEATNKDKGIKQEQDILYKENNKKNKDKIKDFERDKNKNDKNLDDVKDESNEKRSKIKDLSVDNKNRRQELKPRHITQQSDILSYTKKNNRLVIDWAELSRDEAYGPNEESISKDEIKLGLNKSQVIKLEQRPKRARTQSKNDNDIENEEEFYFMKIIQRKKNNGMKKKLFDKLSNQLEQNIKENYIKNKKEDIEDNKNKKKNEKENEKEDDGDENIKKKNINAEKTNILNSSETNATKKSKENHENDLGQNDFELDDNKPEKNLINISLEGKEINNNEDEKEMEEEEEVEENQKEMEKQKELLKQKEIITQKKKELEREKELERGKELLKEKERQREQKEKEKKEKEEKERIEKEREEKEREEKERLEKEREEKERLEKERLEKERLEKERLEKEREEKERLEKEREEKERLEKEREEKERLEKEREEKERLEKEREEKERLEKEREEKERLEKEREEKERLEKEREEKERLEKERLEKEKEEKERLEKEREEKEKEEKEKKEKEKLEKEKQEKERLEKLEKEKVEKEKKQKQRNDFKTIENLIFNPNHNIYETPKRKLPMYDPYQKQSDLESHPKVQPPRQVLELQRLKGKSQPKLPDIQRTYSFSRKKFGCGNLDIVEPGELVSNIKLRLINQMLIRQQSDFGSKSKQTLKNQSQKSLCISSYKKYDSDSDEKKGKKIQIKKKLTDVIKKINDKSLLILIGKFFKKWKNPSKYIKNMPKVKVSLMDCAPPPKQEKKSSTNPIVFLSKSIIQDTEPFSMEEKNKNDNENSVVNIKVEKKENMITPQKVKSGGRIEFVFSSSKQDINKTNEKEKNEINNDKRKSDEEKEEEEVEEEAEELSENNKKNINNKDEPLEIKKLDSKSSNSSSEQKELSRGNLCQKRHSDKGKVVKDNDFNINDNDNDNEKSLGNDLKENEKYNNISSELYNVNKFGNRTKNNVLNLMRKTPPALLEEMNPQIFIEYSKKYNKNVAAYHIYCLYSLFNTNHEFYDKRRIINQWKNMINKSSNYNNIISSFNYYECDNIDHCSGCICFKQNDKQARIKKLLIKYVFMKEYNPMKYYLYLWYKITCN